MDKYRIALSLEEGIGLERLVTVGKSAARKLAHARILLLADEMREACSDAEIVLALGTSLRTIERLRRRFVTEGLWEGATHHRAFPVVPGCC